MKTNINNRPTSDTPFDACHHCYIPLATRQDAKMNHGLPYCKKCFGGLFSKKEVLLECDACLDAVPLSEVQTFGGIIYCHNCSGQELKGLMRRKPHTTNMVIQDRKDLAHFNIAHNAIHKNVFDGDKGRFYVAYVSNSESEDSDVLFYDLESALEGKPAIYFVKPGDGVFGLFTKQRLCSLSSLEPTGHSLNEPIQGVI